MTGAGPRTAPPRYKLAIVTWLAIYPLITGLLWVLQPVVSQLPLPLVTLLLTVILVSVQTFIVMPLMLRLFRPWLGHRRFLRAPRDDASAAPEGG